MVREIPERSTLARIYRQLSIRKKLVLLITSVAGFVTIFSILFSFIVEYNLFKERLLEEYQVTTRMTASNLAVAVAFNDPLDADDVLSVLSVQSHIESAAIYKPDGSLFTSYQNSTPKRQPSLADFESTVGFYDHALVVKEPIEFNESTAAFLVLKADLGELRAFQLGRSWVFVIIIALSLSAAVFLATTVGNHVAKPIIQLAATTRRITEDHDVSTRQVKTSYDETGQLVDAFNEMMEEIEKRSDALVHAKEKAEASSRAKDDFLSVISHELRTPLNPIIGYVEILLRNAHEGENRRQLGLIKQYSEHLQGLIDRVIDFSLFERGEVSLTPEPVNYQRLCANAVSLLETQASEKQIQLLYQHETDRPDSVLLDTLSLDRVKLQQVVLNLLANALKFTEEGSITLKTALFCDQADQTILRIEVVDTGIGIATQDRDTVFKPFSQIDVSLTRQYSGMGLGLAITQRIVEAMGGKIDFDSEKDEGSTFWLEIPVTPTSEQDTDPSLAPSIIENESEDKGRVLLVDDQLVNLELGESMLESTGHQVVRAQSGFEAIELAKAERFNLIILDIKMPRMNGYETARALRKIDNVGATTPIIAMTAHVTSRGNEECLEAGMNDALTKPFNTERLNFILSKWLRSG
ncbi:response regulator [Pelagicoccus albus]|uniref:histidine kinase n=1 Tax=Pelagicoccus albus TaxID=415222 RepID=A0A7X1E954_9BACT|nr:response regulator [Pelagicoccus albus]MBC2606996.1 response regulator [Pelagicoccus albus]